MGQAQSHQEPVHKESKTNSNNQQVKTHSGYKKTLKDKLGKDGERLVSKEHLAATFAHLFGTRELAHTSPSEGAPGSTPQDVDNILVYLRAIKAQKRTPSCSTSEANNRFTTMLAGHYGAHRATLVIGDVALEWNDRSCVVPMISLDFQSKTQQHDSTPLSHASNSQAGLETLTNNAASCAIDFQFTIKLGDLQTSLLDKLIQVIIRYNKYYYHHVFTRNCQHFVLDALNALEIEGPAIITGRMREYFGHLRGKARLEFETHADLDSHIMTHLPSLKPEEIEYCLCMYDVFHLEKAVSTDGEEFHCSFTTCQQNAVHERIQMENLPLQLEQYIPKTPLQLNKSRERSREIFDAAMREGFILSRNTLVLIIGAAGSGKSHTLALVLGEDPPSLQSSTPLATRPVRVIPLTKTGEGWKVIGRDEVLQLVADTALAHVDQGLVDYHSKNPSAFGEKSLTCSKSGEIQQSFKAPLLKRRKSDSAHTIKKSYAETEQIRRRTSRSTSGKSCIEDDITKRMESSSTTSLQSGVRRIEHIHVIDSGGQPQFHEVLLIFLRIVHVCFLVHRLDQPLSAYPLIGYYKEGVPSGRPFPSSLSNKQILQHCLKATASKTMRSSDKTQSKVVFVGTHRDLEASCSETREEKEKQLQSIVPPTLRDSVQYHGETMTETIFPLNAKEPKDEDHQVASELRKLVEKFPAEERMLPLPWNSLELAIHKLMKQFDRKILHKDEIREEAELLYLDDDSFDEALKHLHSLSNIFYIDSLPDIIFGDSQIPLDKLTELLDLLYTLRAKPATHAASAGSLAKLRDQGIVTEALLQNEKLSSHYVQGLFESADLLTLFEALHIAAKVGKGEYLMPCLLPVNQEIVQSPTANTHNTESFAEQETAQTLVNSTAQSSSNTEKMQSPFPHIPKPIARSSLPSKSSSTPTLLLHFPDGPLLGQFCALVANLLSEAKWKLLRDEGRVVQITRNSIAFEIPDIPGRVTLSDPFSSYFQVSIEIPAKLHRDKCPMIRSTILNGLCKASDALHYEHSEPQDAFYCQGRDGRGCVSPPHPATVAASTSHPMLKCTIKPGSTYSELTAEQRLWLDLPTSESGDQPTVPSLIRFPGVRGTINIPQEIGTNYTDFATFLLEDDTGAKTSSLVKSYREDSKEINTAILRDWIQGKGKRPVTWATLANVLEDIGLTQLAEDIREVKLYS